MLEDILVVVKGGGDLATGVAHRLHRVGMKVVVTELAQPTVIRRAVAFASAVFEGEVTVEGMMARRAENVEQALALLSEEIIPVLVDPHASVLRPDGSTGSPRGPVEGLPPTDEKAGYSLLDESEEPKPAYHALQTEFNRRWGYRLARWVDRTQASLLGPVPPVVPILAADEAVHLGDSE